jgi:hypothetical protein
MNKLMATKHLGILRAGGAVSLLVVGGVHLEQYKVAGYSVIPTIGPLFLVNFIAAMIAGLVLLVPLGAAPQARRLLLDSLAAIVGIAVAAGSLAALLISEQTPLFGFMEHGYRLVIVISIAAEALAVVVLGLVLTGAYARSREIGATSLGSPSVIKTTKRRTFSEN